MPNNPPSKFRGDSAKRKKYEIISTAYGKPEANIYDERRFSDPRGILFNKFEMEQFERALKQIPKSLKVLEVGCGTGRFILKALLEGHEVHGIDASLAMLKESARKTISFDNVYYYLDESANLPFEDKSFDFVYSIRVLNQLSSESYALNSIREMVRVCKEKGLILLEFVNKKGLTRNRETCVQLSVKDIHRAIDDYEMVKIIDLSGILFFSQSLMNLVPIALLSLFEKVDKFFSKLLPYFSTRCYIILYKGQNGKKLR